jgi:hypothetical protein
LGTWGQAARRNPLAVAGGAGHRFQRLRIVLEQGAGALDAQAFDVGGRRLADLGSERAREGTLAEARALGEGGDREVLVEVPGDPGLQLTQRRSRGLLDREGRPLLILMRPSRAGPTISIRYEPGTWSLASQKVSTGPITSSDWTPSTARTRTRRIGGMPTILPPGRRGG